MSVTSSDSSINSSYSNHKYSPFCFSSSSDHSFDSFPALYACPKMAPPKVRKDGNEPLQLAHQHSHINYKSNLKIYDIDLALARSVCSTPLKYRTAFESECCNIVVPNHVAFYTTVHSIIVSSKSSIYKS